MWPELTTERLRLRPWRLDDLEFFVKMDMDPEVGRYLFPHGPPMAEERRATMRSRMASHWPGRGAIWTVAWAGNGETLGWCGLFPFEDTGLIEIGYRFVTAAWGQGVATEAARRVLGHGFRDFEFDPIVAVTHPENSASQNVLKKIGLRSGGLQFHYGLDFRFLSLARADYLSAQ